MKIFYIPLLSLLCALPVFSEGTSVDYTVNGKPYEGHYIPGEDKAPLILLLHDWDGLTEYEVKRAGMLADQGYAVFSADLFGKGIRPTEVKDKRQHTGELYGDREKLRSLVQGALDAAGKQGADTENVVVVGYCFGGAAALEYARSGAEAKAFVTFHGGLKTPEGQDYSQTKGEVVVFHGTADTAITMDEFATLAKELEEHKVAHELITYGGAPHAFTVFGSGRYHKESDTRSWSRFTAFLKKTVPVKTP